MVKQEPSNPLNDLITSLVNEYRTEETVITCDSRSLTAKQLVQLSDHYVQYLAGLGITTGSRVGYSMPNCPEIIPLVVALFRMGACAIPVFHLVPDMGKMAIFTNSAASLVITTEKQSVALNGAAEKTGARLRIVSIDGDFAGLADDAKQTVEVSHPSNLSPSLPCLMASSSGTTGTPKMVAWSRANGAALLKSSEAMIRPIVANSTTRPSTLAAFPLASAGVVNMLGTLLGGVRIIVSADVSPVGFIKLLAENRPDSLSAPPALFEAILSMPLIEAIDTSSVRWIFTGMDFCTPSLLQRLRNRFTRLEGFASGYGLIETTNVFMTCTLKTADELVGPTNVFSVVPGVGNRIEIRDEHGTPVAPGESGELFVKGPSVVGGYLGNPQETAAGFIDGWFKSGDTARCDGNDTITLLGRKKYLIKRGGKSISPIVVQEHLNKLPGIRESAVVGVPHPLYGEMAWAFLAAGPGNSLTLGDVMKHCRESLVNYMVPDQVRFVDAIPRKAGAGKIDFDAMIRSATEELSLLNGATNG